MDVKTVLGELGLSEGESKVYLALLKLGSSPVSKVKEETQLHRTTIYDFVEKLLNKGLINYVVRNNVKYYKAADPQKLMEFLKEKQDHLLKVMPELDKMAKFTKEEVKVEVYKGKEGLKTAMLECVRIGDEVLGMGLDDIMWKKELPIFIDQYQRMIREKNIHERILTKVNPGYLFDQRQTHYKFIPEDLFSPTHTLVYGNKIQMVMFEPKLTTIVIDNKKLANAYRKHFNVLWEQESMIFRGIENVKTIFEEMANTLKNGDEYLAFGVPESADYLADFFSGIMKKIEEKGVDVRVIFDKRAKGQIKSLENFKRFKYKTQHPDFMSPSEVSIYGNKVALILWGKVPQAFVINNKEIANSFRKYFEVMWKTAK
ncbi:MAG: helix-turn-helix domain-containing protein [Candidatus Woesearchaeota archaeon]